jgi:hypothetical protein
LTRPVAPRAAQELDARVRALRDDVKKTRKEYDKTEDDLKALQSVGQIIGEVLRQLDDERCACPLLRPLRADPRTGGNHHMLTRATHHTHTRTVIVKASSGPRYVVGCRTKLDKSKLTQGTRVALDMTTLTIMRALPREVRAAVLLPPGCCARARSAWRAQSANPRERNATTRARARTHALRAMHLTRPHARRWTPWCTTCSTKTPARCAPCAPPGLPHRSAGPFPLPS